MKITIILISALVLAYVAYATWKRDKRVIETSLESVSLKDNVLGEKSSRKLIIYLPPDYEESDKKYPVVYFLHGFTANYQQFYEFEFKKYLDKAFKGGKRGFILVMPDSYNEFKGSFYANEWADYIAKDVVSYVDANYRTLANPDSRGIAGHSMGGNGALKLAMLHPDVFGSVYAMSPSVLDWSSEFTLENPSFRVVNEAKTKDEVFSDFYASVLTAMARTYSPNPASLHFQADFPVVYQEEKREIDSAILAKWNLQFPSQIFERDSNCLKNSRGILIDWGQQDPYPHIPVTCKALGEAMKSRGLKVRYESYEGDHTSGLLGENGRIAKEFINFFDKTLINN